MIHANMFSSDESPGWDFNVLRKCLCIPEDQLNVLSNIEGWSKPNDNANTFRLEKETTIADDTQSSEFHIPTATQNFQKSRQIISFDDSLLLQRSVVRTDKAYINKFARSVSLCEINKIGESLSEDRSLKRILSLPVLNQVSYGSCLTSDSEAAFIKKYSSQSKKLLPDILILNSKNTSASKSISTTKATLKIMEVEPQIPVTISCHTDNVVSSESKTQVEISSLPDVHASESLNNMKEKIINVSLDTENVSSNESNIHLIEKIKSSVIQEMKISGNSPVINLSNTEKAVSNGSADEVEKMDIVSVDNSKTDNSSNQPTDTINKLVCAANNKSVMYEEHKILLDSNSIEINLNSCIVKETVPAIDAAIKNNSEKLIEITETDKHVKTLNSASKEQLTSIENSVFNSQKHSNFEKLSEDKLDSCIAKETASANVNINIGASSEKMNSEKLTDTLTGNLVVIFAPNEQPPSVETSFHNTQNSDKFMNDQNCFQQENVAINNSAAVKRKLEVKVKSSKKRKSNREKSQFVEARSIKRAEEIQYTDEDIRTMIHIIKCFL